MKLFIEVITISGKSYKGKASELSSDEMEIVKDNIEKIFDPSYKINKFCIETFSNEGHNVETVYFNLDKIEAIKVVEKE